MAMDGAGSEQNMLLGGGGGVPFPAPAAPAAGNPLVGAEGGADPRAMLAPILEGATNPDTGEVNYNRAFVGLASTPATAPFAQGFLEQAAARGATSVPVALSELEREYVKARLVAGVAKSLVPLAGNVTIKDLVHAISSPEFARAVPDPRMRAQILASAPRGGSELGAWVAQHAAHSEGAAQAMESVLRAAHVRVAEQALTESALARGDVDELMNAPGWVGRAAQKLVLEYPQMLDGRRAPEKMRLVAQQLGALREQEKVARTNYTTLAPPGAPPFEAWWEQNLASQGII